MLARFSPRGQSNPASELIRAHAYWRRCGRIADLVLLHDAAPADELHDQLERLGVLRQNLSTGVGAVSPRSMRLTQSGVQPDRVSVLAHGTVERVPACHRGNLQAHERPASRRTPGVKLAPIRRLAARIDGGARRLLVAPRCDRRRPPRRRGPRVCLCRAPGEFGSCGNTPGRIGARAEGVAR